MRSSNTRYLVGLDHLRGFGAILIVFYHALHVLSFGVRAGTGDPSQFWVHTLNPFIALIEEGHTSVALFMVLSGFVFSVAAEGREIAYWPFVKNRFLRVYPLYIVVMLAGLAALPSAYSPPAMFQALLFQANYAGALNLPPYSSMFWAVAVEFQFYLLFPFLHRFIERYGARWIMSSIALFILLRFCAATTSSSPRDVSYWHLIARLDQFLLGMWSARLFSRWELRNVPWGLITLVCGACVATMLVAFNQLGGFPAQGYWKVAWPTIEGLGWASVLLSYTAFAKRMPALISKPLAALGTVSYSVYLLHFVCLMIVPRWIPLWTSDSPNVTSQLYALGVILPILLPLSALSYYAVERPFLNMRVRYLRDLPAVPAEIASVRPAANASSVSDASAS